jgi:hypothetical protein
MMLTSNMIVCHYVILKNVELIYINPQIRN